MISFHSVQLSPQALHQEESNFNVNYHQNTLPEKRVFGSSISFILRNYVFITVMEIIDVYRNLRTITKIKLILPVAKYAFKKITIHIREIIIVYLIK